MGQEERKGRGDINSNLTLLFNLWLPSLPFSPHSP